jgi:hypothetical protein
MEKKQTAVEYLVEQLESIGFSTNDLADYYNEVQIALEMEKEQMKEMYLKGIENYDPEFPKTSKLTQVKFDLTHLQGGIHQVESEGNVWFQGSLTDCQTYININSKN